MRKIKFIFSSFILTTTISLASCSSAQDGEGDNAAVTTNELTGQAKPLGQTTITSFDNAKDEFYSLYDEGELIGIYCNIELDGSNRSIEHVIPVSWIAQHFYDLGYTQCTSRKTCDVEEYGYAEADLHNLLPAHRSINSSRGG